MNKNLVKIARACGSGDILSDRQTDRQTHSSQYFATALAGEVKTSYSTQNDSMNSKQPRSHDFSISEDHVAAGTETSDIYCDTVLFSASSRFRYKHPQQLYVGLSK